MVLNSSPGRLESPSDTDALLGGVRVLEVGTGIALSYCGKLFAQFGAEVLKVEPPSGDSLRRRGPFVHGHARTESSLLFQYLNTGKHSATLDHASDTGRDLLSRLVDGVDVIIEAREPGRGDIRLAGDLPLAASTILVSLTPFGEGGPYEEYLATELVLLALGGLLYLVGEEDQEPLRLGGYQAQQVQGLSAFTGALAALHVRELTGLGQRVDVAAQDCVASVEWKGGTYYQANGVIRRRGGSQGQWLILPCQDGVVAFVYQDTHWPAVKALMADPRLEDARFASRAGRLRHREELRGLLSGWTLARGKHDVYLAAQERGIPVGMVADVAELIASPQNQQRHFFQTVDHPSTGPVLHPGPPVTVDGVRPMTRRAPLLGEHNATIYGEQMGIPSRAIDGLRERGVI